MRKPHFGRPSPALVVSTIALIVAMGGTSYAAFSLPNNSVGTKQLKNGAVTGSKIKNGAVNGSKIANNTITGNKIQLSTLGTVPSANHANSANSAINSLNAFNSTNATHATSATSAGSATNATNANNATLAASANALNGVVYVQSGSFANPGPGSQDEGVAICPSGTFVTGGGAFGNGGTEQSINSSLPDFATSTTAPDEWDVFMDNTSTTATADTFNVYAICAPLSNPSLMGRRAQHK